jgi:hypothetical protein
MYDMMPLVITPAVRYATNQIKRSSIERVKVTIVTVPMSMLAIYYVEQGNGHASVSDAKHNIGDSPWHFLPFEHQGSQPCKQMSGEYGNAEPQGNQLPKGI